MKKNVLILALSFVLASTSVVFAASEEKAEKNLVNETTTVEEIAQAAEQPAVEITPKKKWFNRKAKEDKNTVFVADLKGGVEISPAETAVEIEEMRTPLKDWLEGDYMTGDWGGWRTQLEEHGVTFEATYLSDTFMKLYGGTEKSKYPIKNFGLVDAAILLDTEKLGLWKNGQFAVRYQFKRGSYIGDHYIGSYQFLDAYDAGHLNQLAEYWYEQGLFDNKIQLKIGKQDACFDFMALDLATNFVNNSHAYFMPNVPLPAYPDPALGVVLKINPTDWLSLRTGWYDGKSKGSTSGFDTAFGSDKASFFIQEIGIRHNRNNMPGTILAGGWLHTGHVDSLSIPGETKAQTLGSYIEAEQMVWKENKADAEDTQGLFALVQYSYAPDNRSEIVNYFGNTLMYKGLIRGRNEDVTGIGAAIAQFSNKLRHIQDDGRRGVETILEAFYKIQVTPWFSLQPVVQYVIRPDGQQANAFVLGLRSVLTF